MKSKHGVRAVGRLITLAVAVWVISACGGKNPDQLVASAKDYLAKSDINAAAIQLKNALQAAPDNGEARLLLGTTLLRQRDFASADKELRRALELGQASDAVLPSLAHAMVELGEFDKLVKEFGDRKLADPEAQASFSTRLGEAQLRLGRVKEAAASYSAALAAKANHGPARLGQAIVAAIGGDRAEAAKIIDSVLAANPKNADAHTLKADLLSAEGKRDEARKSLERAVEADAGHLPARRALAQMLIEDKAFDQAAAQIEAARKVTRGDLSFSYLEGLLAFEKGDLQKARDQVAQVLKYSASHVPTLMLAGAVELKSKQFATAEAHLRKAIALAPNHIGARRLLIGAYLQNGEPAKALDVLQPLMNTPAIKDPRIAMLAGETLLANGDAKQASVYFAAASSADNMKTAAQTRLGQLALARGDFEGGLKQLEAVSEQDAAGVQADLSLIAAHLRRNEVDKALAAARALEKKQPNSPLSHLMLGTVHVARKDAAAARKSFEKSVELQPTYLPAVAALANLDLLDKKPEQARKRFEEVVAREPNNEQALLGLAEVQARTGSKSAEVAATLQRAITANPQSANARAALVSLHLRERNVKEALRVAQESVGAIPSDPRLLSVLASAQEASGATKEAIETLNKLASLQPQASLPLQQLAELHGRRQEFDLAADALRRAQRVAPDDRDVRMKLAMAQARTGKFEEALKEAKAIQSKEPKFAGGYALEAELYGIQKRWPDAERAAREALKLEPRASGVAVQLHGALVGAGKAIEADAHARKWLAANPRDVRMRMYLAERALATKNTKGAFGLYQETIAIEPNNAVALNNLAYIAGELGDARAVEYAERAVKLAPESAAILDTLGMLLVGKGETAKGFEYLDRARALAPNVPALRLNYAKALAKAGRKDEAKKELEALRELTGFAGKDEVEALLKSL